MHKDIEHISAIFSNCLAEIKQMNKVPSREDIEKIVQHSVKGSVLFKKDAIKLTQYLVSLLEWGIGGPSFRNIRFPEMKEYSMLGSRKVEVSSYGKDEEETYGDQDITFEVYENLHYYVVPFDEIEEFKEKKRNELHSIYVEKGEKMVLIGKEKEFVRFGPKELELLALFLKKVGSTCTSLRIIEDVYDKKDVSNERIHQLKNRVCQKVGGVLDPYIKPLIEAYYIKKGFLYCLIA